MHTFIDNIITFSLRNKFFIFFCTTITVIAGITSFIHTPIDAFPDVTNTKVTIITQAGQERRGDREVYHNPDRDRHEPGTEKDGYPEHDPFRSFRHQRDVRR